MTEWAYCIDGHEIGRGPFESREEAIEEATDCCEPGTVVQIGTVEWCDPADHLPDFECFLQGIDESAKESDFGFWDDPCFLLTIEEGEQAEEELKAWARKWLKPACWVLRHTEDVITGDPDAP